MGKGSETKQTTSLPPEITAAAQHNINLANDVAALPYMPNFGTQVAAMTPAQKASYAGVQGMASAFGMPHTGTSDADMGLPTKVIHNADGTSGYSTEDMYKSAIAKLSPAMQAMLSQFHYDPLTGANPTNPNLKVTPISVPGNPSASPPVGNVNQPPTPAAPPQAWHQPANAGAYGNMVEVAPGILKDPNTGKLYNSVNGTPIVTSMGGNSGR